MVYTGAELSCSLPVKCYVNQVKEGSITVMLDSQSKKRVFNNNKINKNK